MDRESDNGLESATSEGYGCRPPDPSWPKKRCTGCSNCNLRNNCECIRDGLPCTSHCSCNGECQGPTSQLHDLFGITAQKYSIRGGQVNSANACFMSYLHEKYRDSGCWWREGVKMSIDQDEIFDKLISSRRAFKVDPMLGLWQREVEGKELQDPKNKEWKQALLRHALGAQRDHEGNILDKPGKDECGWCFCRDHWVRKARMRHCQTCKKCCEWDAWHICRDGSDVGPPMDRNIDGWAPKEMERPRLRHPQRLPLRGTKRKRGGEPDDEDEDDGITEVFFTPPEDIASRPCDCANGCNTRRCPCRAWGSVCKPSCPCHSTNNSYDHGSCENPMNKAMVDFLGYKHTHLQATPCFAKFLEHKALGGWSKRHLNYAHLERLLLADEEAFAPDTELGRWYLTLKGCRKGSQRRDDHIATLFRLGLSERETAIRSAADEARKAAKDVRGGAATPPLDMETWVPSEPIWFFSFCNLRWEDAWRVTHCPVCGTCVQVGQVWHCYECSKCRDGGWRLNEPCVGCGGLSVKAGDDLERRKRKRREAEVRGWDLGVGRREIGG